MQTCSDAARVLRARERLMSMRMLVKGPTQQLRRALA